jgi:hypothetical protein
MEDTARAGGHRRGMRQPDEGLNYSKQLDRIPMAVRKASRSLPDSELALRAIAMPVFANAHGDIFGGLTP